MSALAGNDSQAADCLAPAWLDDGAPPGPTPARAAPPQVSVGTKHRASPEVLPPSLIPFRVRGERVSGRIRGVGHGLVAAPLVAVTAAAASRAHRQMTPAVLGAG
jgi:hypothetical protein